jgi:hypothetical protein
MVSKEQIDRVVEAINDNTTAFETNSIGNTDVPYSIREILNWMPELVATLNRIADNLEKK